MHSLVLKNKQRNKNVLQYLPKGKEESEIEETRIEVIGLWIYYIWLWKINILYDYQPKLIMLKQF